MSQYSRLSAPKRSTVDDLCSFVGSTPEQSIALLEKFNWSCAEAADAYFSGDVDIDALVRASRSRAAAAVPTPDFAALDVWFDRYVDADDPNAMLDDGIQTFYTELGVDTQDLVVLVISWKMQAEEMCIYTRDEWRRGMSTLGVSSTRQLRRMLNTLRAEVDDRRSAAFQTFYMYCFDYAKERSKKSIELDVCLSLWELVLATPEFPLLKDFSEFLKTSKVPVVTKDMWAQTLAFFCQVKADLSNFDESDAWPVVVDDFVEMKMSQQKASQSETARP